MPSDDRILEALAALGGARETFRAAVAAAAEEVRGFIAAHRTPADGAGARAALELGPFAAGRLDFSRFGALFGGAEPLDAQALDWLTRAQAVLAESAAADYDLYHVKVPAGADLRAAAVAALGRAGRAFGAARVVELVRGARFRAAEHAGYLESFPPALWTRAERELAPPVVLDLAGADLQVGGLGELLQGAQKIVLVARGAAPPAALVRLVTPGTFVMQARATDALNALAGVAGPAVAALLDGGVEFVHDPAAGAALKARLSLGELPAEEVRAPIGRYSAAQQAEELQQLVALSKATSAPEPVVLEGGALPAGATLADKLAAWLLQQAAIPAI